MPAFRDLTNLSFGHWTVTRRAADYRPGIVMWECRCVCGATKAVRACTLISGKSTNCGCVMAKNTSARCRGVAITHGMRNAPVYYIWRSMLQRCTNPRNRGFHRYGGRGIGVCERWRKFENFFADMGDRPDGMTLERINNSLGYSPENCTWATRSENNNNRGSCVLISHDGLTMTANEWQRRTGIPDYTILRRIRAGWPMEKVFLPGRFHRWNRP